jgi:hypothetical protein
MMPAQYTNPPIPAMIQGPNGAYAPQLNPGPGMIPPGADPSQMLPPNHQPVYPPPGPYAQTMYESPYPGGGGPGAGGPGGGGFDMPGPVAPRVWFKGDYLLMFLSPQPNTNVLVTTGLNNPGGTTDNGVLGQPSTVSLFGQDNFHFPAASGFRLEGGFWGSDDQRIGASVSAFYIPPTSLQFYGQSGSNGSPLFGRPFNNINPNTATILGTTGGADNAIVSGAGFGTGNILAQVTSRFFGIDANAVVNLYRSEPGGNGCSFNLTAGYRYMQLQESILIQSNTLLTAAVNYNNIPIAAGSNVAVRDYFDTRNQFNGAQVGFETQATRGRWVFSAYGKFAAGVNNQQILIEGNTSDGGANNFVGGVYANSGNIGVYKSNTFAMGADANATIGYQFTPRLAGTIGYNFVYLSNVARPGNAINPNIDPTTAPGVPNTAAATPVGSPAFAINRDDFYMHGMNFGFSLTY